MVNAKPDARFPIERGWLSAMGRGLDRALLGLTYLAIGLLLFMGASVIYEIFLRYVFNRPTRWVVEFSEYMLLYIGLLAGGWVLKQEGHVRIELLTDELPLKAQAVLHTVTSLVGALVCGVFFGFSATFTWETYWTGELLFRSVLVPKWAVLVVIPFGQLLLALQFIRRAFVFKTAPDTESEPFETPGL